MVTWESDQRFVAGGITFQTLPPDLFENGRAGIPMEGADFLLAKPRKLVERYLELLADLQPQHVFELGIFQGGSTALLAEVARPRRLVAIDRTTAHGPLEKHVSRTGLGDAVRIYRGVDQADRGRLAEIVEEAFAADPLDLVVDDCSHRYEATRASFNELFPRLRPGGVYVIEDWPWAHTPIDAEALEGAYPGQVPLTRLGFELVLAIPSVPGLITEVTVEMESIQVRRGEATVDAGGFDISACSNPRGRDMLAPI